MEKTMKLGEALTLLKSRKGEMARILEQRRKNFYVSEGKEPHFKYADQTKEIGDLREDIVGLKIAVIEANAKNSVLGGDVSIQEAILRVGELRSELANLQAIIKEAEDQGRYLFSRDKEIVRDPQVPLSVVEERIRDLTREKTALDARIQDSNWRYDVKVELRGR
jgi:hypothetical protein